MNWRAVCGHDSRLSLPVQQRCASACVLNAGLHHAMFTRGDFHPKTGDVQEAAISITYCRY